MVSLLPFEILENIFKLLDREDLVNCRSTCKQWKMAAEVKLRETVQMNDFTFAGIKRLQHIIKNSSNVANKVKHIDISRGYREKNRYYSHIVWALDDISKNCRNIETITGIDGRIANDIWSKILVAVNSGYLRRLQSLPTVPECLSDIRHYYAPITWQLRSSLKKRDLRCNSLEYQKMFKGDPPNIWLYDFISLEELTFYFGAKNVFTIIDCNNLIDLCSKHQSIESLILRKGYPYRSQGDSYQFPEKDITPCTNIKQLTIMPSCVLNGKLSIRYLIHKFPNLTKLRIDCPCLFKSSREELFSLLADYISHINQVQIFYSYTDEANMDSFLTHLLKSCNMTRDMVDVCALPMGCHTPWLQINQSQLALGSYEVKDYR